MIVFLFLLGAYAYRLRGDSNEGGFIERHLGFIIGTQGGRLIWSFVVSSLLAFKVHDLAFFIMGLPLVFVGVMFGYFGAYFDLSNKDNLRLGNLARLTLRGMFIMFPLAFFTLPFKLYFLWYGVAAGALFVPFYYIGAKIALKIPMVAGNTQWGEWLLGGAILALTFWG